ncbi:hypothetical protein LIQ05_15075, partial [Blautia glucerasea]|uniref:hypothetical protein n=1 Tax=Blautia glucerasea TaxID=536633 RepID=UPI001D00BF6C
KESWNRNHYREGWKCYKEVRCNSKEIKHICRNSKIINSGNDENTEQLPLLVKKNSRAVIKPK